MSKIRRKVTVEGDKSSDDEGGSKRSKVSVFERLGAAKKSFDNDDRCRNWVKHGTCPYGPTCRFTHGRPKRKGEVESDDDGKHRKHRAEKHRSNRSQSPSPKRGASGHGRKDKDGKMKSAIVVKKRLGRGGAGGESDGESNSPQWEGEEGTLEDLDYKDELQLEQKRQEIQRVLQQLAPSEEERDNITIEKKVSSSSDSSSSSGSSSGSSSSSSSSGSPSPPRKQKTRRQKISDPNRSPSGHRGRSPPHPNRPSPSQQARLKSPPGRSSLPPEQTRRQHREKIPETRERSGPQVDISPSAQRERAARREITPNPHDRSQESSPSRPASPWNPGASWSPEKPGHAVKGARPGLKKKKVEKQEKKSKLKGPRTPSPNAEWEDVDKAKDKNREAETERERIGHREKAKKKHRSPFVQEKGKRKGYSQSPPPVERSKGRRSPSPEFVRKRPDVPTRHDSETENDSPLLRSSRRSPSPGKEKSKKVKRRGRALSVSPLRTKKLSPGPAKVRDSGQDQRKEKLRDTSVDDLPYPEMSPERGSKDKSFVRSPGQPHHKHKKRKDSSAEKKKKHHGSQDLMSPGKRSRKRSFESPVTPVKSSRRKSSEKGQQESPTKRTSRSKSGKRKDRKASKNWEPTPPKSEEMIRSRGEADSSRTRQSSPEPSLSRSRDIRRTPPPELFDPRSRGSDPRRAGTPPPQHRPESPEGFRQSGPGSPPHFPRVSRDDPNFPPGHRRREEEFGRPPPGSASPPGGRRGRDSRYRDDFEAGHGRHSDIPGRMDRFSDPRNRDRVGRFPEIRPLFDERSGSRMDQERQMFEMERVRFEREEMRGREGIERERFGRDRFSGRSDRFDNGRGGRDPRSLGSGVPPPWEREFGREGLEGRNLPGDRFQPARGFDEGLPDRLSRRGDWENRRPDFREDWNSRSRGVDRRDMRMGRRGEFMESRDGRRFDEPRMLRGMEREEMLRVRLDGDFRDRPDRRELPDLRDLPFPDMHGRDERRDDRQDERRDDRRDERRREERDGDRKPDRRDDSRKRAHDGEDDRGRSPPVKRQREMSPGGSLRSHHSNLEEARAAEWERERERRRRERSQDDGRQDIDSEGRRSRRSEDPRFKDLETFRDREGNVEIGRDEASKRSSHEGEKSSDRDLNRRRDAADVDPEGSGAQERDAIDREQGNRNADKVGDKESEDTKGMRRRDPDGILDKEADKDSLRSSGRESRRGRTSSQGRESQSSKGRTRDIDRDSISDRDRSSPHSRSDQRHSRSKDMQTGREHHRDLARGRDVERNDKDRDSLSDQTAERDSKVKENDHDTVSEKDWRREGSRGLSTERYSRSETGNVDKKPDIDDMPRSKSTERTLTEIPNIGDGDQVQKLKEKVAPDAVSENGSTRKSSRKERVAHGGNKTTTPSKDDSKLADVDTDRKSVVKGEGGEMYDPFDAGSDHRESQERALNKDGKLKQEVDRGSESGRPKRRLSTGSHGDDGQAKKQRMIELSEGGDLTETIRPESRRLGEGDGRLPFSGDKEERRSQTGDVYSDWSSADDADDILRRTDALPFSNNSRNGEAENGDIQSMRSNLDRKRRSPSRSSHGSRRDKSRDDRGRDKSRDDCFRDDRNRTSRPSSRHSSYDRYRDERRRFEAADRERSQTYTIEPKSEESADRPNITTESQLDTGDLDEKGDLLEKSMDYEEISDEEMGGHDDTDSKGVVSPLQLDWSSLAQDQRPSTTSSSTLQRFKPAQVFQRIGIEKAFAGDAMFEKIKTFCQNQLEEETNEADVKTDGEKPSNGHVKEDEETKPKQTLTLHHNIAAFHASSMIKMTERANLFRNIGGHRRALCARRDLDIRRQLCSLDKIMTGGKKFLRLPVPKVIA